MDRIIVSILDPDGAFLYDMDLPWVEPLEGFLPEVLDFIKEKYPHTAGCTALFCQRTGQTVQESLSGSGIRNGDWLKLEQADTEKVI